MPLLLHARERHTDECTTGLATKVGAARDNFASCFLSVVVSDVSGWKAPLSSTRDTASEHGVLVAVQADNSREREMLTVTVTLSMLQWSL